MVLSVDGDTPTLQPESDVEINTYTPESIYRTFEWEGGFASKDKCLPQFENFLEIDPIGSKLGLTGSEVWQSLEDNFDLADDWYKAFFPKGEMEYHNLQHVKNTATVAMKIFVTRLAWIKEQNKGVGWEDPQLTKRMVQTAAAVFALHEVDDWWTRRVNPSDEIGMKLLTDKKTELRVKLVAQGIKLEDFDRMVALGDFSKQFNEVLTQQMEQGGDNLLMGVTGSQKEDVAKAFGWALNSADFAQVCNSSYGEDIVVETGGKKYKTLRGPAVLAVEHSLYRNKALYAAGWAVSPEKMKILDNKRDQADRILQTVTGDRRVQVEKLKEKIAFQRINWEKVVWGEWFLYEMAIPRIQMGTDDLNKFDSQESGRMWAKIRELEVKLPEKD